MLECTRFWMWECPSIVWFHVFVVILCNMLFHTKIKIFITEFYGRFLMLIDITIDTNFMSRE
jgi:hypothetical protein